jgi:hypothetical protein
MQEKDLFEYAVIRVVPRVEREEFINVGVILYCPRQKFLQALFHIDEQRLRTFCAEADPDEIRTHLEAIERICKGAKEAGPIGLLDMPSRFRWLTAMRSTVVQTSRVHPGFSSNAEETLQRLYREQVL